MLTIPLIKFDTLSLTIQTVKSHQIKYIGPNIILEKKGGFKYFKIIYDL